MERDFFMSPQEATEYGIIDAVITHRDVARAGGGGLAALPTDVAVLPTDVVNAADRG